MTGTRAVIAALLALGLAACSGSDPEPNVAPPTSSSPGDESSSPVVRSTPEETVAHWIAAQNRALTSGNTAAVRALSHEPCPACDQFIDPIERVYRAGGKFDTAGWTLEGSHLRSETSVPRVVDVGVTIAGGRTVKAAGAEPVVYGAEKHLMVFMLEPADDGWAVSFIGFIS